MQVHPPLCGGGCRCVSEKNQTGVPIPLRPRLDRRDSGVTASVGGRLAQCTLGPPQDVPIPPRHGEDRRDSGVTAAVWRRMVRCILTRGNRDARGVFAGIQRHPSPHGDGCTRVPPVPPGPRRDRDAP